MNRRQRTEIVLVIIGITLVLIGYLINWHTPVGKVATTVGGALAIGTAVQFVLGNARDRREQSGSN